MFFYNIFRTYQGKKYLKCVLPVVIVFILVKITMKNAFLSEYFYARGISRVISVALQSIFSLIPFSVLEVIVTLGIIITIIMIGFTFKKNIGKTDKEIYDFLLRFVYIITIIVIGYNVTATALFNRYSVAYPLGLTVKDTNDEKMIDAANYYLNNLIELNNTIERSENGNIKEIYTFSELNDMIAQEYERLDRAYFTANNINLKKIHFSRAMTYTGITGVYVGILGEGSINTNVPPFTLPITMAHEMAHGKGVMRENEANFVAYYLCITSDNDYLRYTGNMYAFNITVRSIKDRDTKIEIWNSAPEEIRREFQNATEFYKDYEGLTEKIAEFINNINLKSAGVKEGVLSYSMTERYLVALYDKLSE